MFHVLAQIIDGDCVSCFPVYPQPFLYPTCPNVQPGSVGICLQNCSSDSDCTNGQKCCSNGCGRACTQPTLVSYYNVSAQQCSHVRAQFNVTRRPPLGAYIPQCDSGGHYSPVQCHEGFCWCVHTQTGLPLSSFYERGERPRCTSE